MSRTSGQARRASGDPALAVPSEYAAHLVDVAGRFGVRADRLLADSGVHPRMLDGARAVLPRGAFFSLVERALSLTGEPGLGFYYGLSLKLSSHGPLGLLAMTSPTLRDALSALERFMPLRATEISVRIEQRDDQLAVVFAHAVPPALQGFFTEAFFVMLLHIGRALSGRPLSGVCEHAYREPAHFRRFSHLLPAGARFAQPDNRLLLSAELLEQAVVTSDEVMARRVERECQAELAALDRRLSFVSKVRRDLRAARESLPSLEQTAERRGISERTLKRKLAAQGTSFRLLVEELRKERAIALLRDETHAVETIAARLGYADKASFHRAFRRWFGTTPGAFRAAGT
jgi:AraC-like DNA-binding protein